MLGPGFADCRRRRRRRRRKEKKKFIQSNYFQNYNINSCNFKFF
jgi:hypothetical protein